MYKQYTDKLVEETWEWRRLVALRAHYADIIDKLEQIEQGEMEGTQIAMDQLEDLHPSCCNYNWLSVFIIFLNKKTFSLYRDKH